MSTRLTIVCDRCGARSAEFKNAGGTKTAEVRGRLRLAGWQTLDRRGFDYCPKCKDKPDGKIDHKNG